MEEEQELRTRPFIYLIDRSGREHLADEKIITDYLAGRIEVVGTHVTRTLHKPTKVSERKNRALLEAGFLRSKFTAPERGRFDQFLLAEQYPTFRWHFDWHEYVVVGVPDGITARFVYEFKSTKELDQMKAVAQRQADLYGYFFGREHKRIQIRDVSGGKILTFSSPIDRMNAGDGVEALCCSAETTMNRLGVVDARYATQASFLHAASKNALRANTTQQASKRRTD